MPFRSDAQRKYLFAKEPALARRWADKYGGGGNLPEHVGDSHAARRKAIMGMKKHGKSRK